MVEISFEELKVSRATADGTQLETVRPMTGTLRAGQLTAIMGGSGSGKSTFFRALRGMVDVEETRGGRVIVNGKEVSIRGRWYSVIPHPAPVCIASVSSLYMTVVMAAPPRCR